MLSVIIQYYNCYNRCYLHDVYKSQNNTKLFYFRYMIQQWLNLRTALLLLAVLIVSGTIFYSDYLSKKIGKEETQKVAAWVEAQRTIMSATDQTNLNLATKIATENDDI